MNPAEWADQNAIYGLAFGQAVTYGITSLFELLLVLFGPHLDRWAANSSSTSRQPIAVPVSILATATATDFDQQQAA